MQLGQVFSLSIQLDVYGPLKVKYPMHSTLLHTLAIYLISDNEIVLLPGLSTAGSMMSNLFVAAMMYTPFLSSTPSISVNS